jgi:hypothetical protein
MDEEMVGVINNDTWDLVQLHVGNKPIRCKWVFKKKIDLNGIVEKQRVRLVAKRYSQVDGIEFGEIFSLIAKLISIRFILFVIVDTLEIE